LDSFVNIDNMAQGMLIATVGTVVTAILLFIVVWAANKYEEKLADRYQADSS